MSLQDNTQCELFTLVILIGVGDVEDFTKRISQRVDRFGHVTITSSDVELPDNNGDGANTPEAIIIR